MYRTLAPLGKSDHVVLDINIKLNAEKPQYKKILNSEKGNYTDFNQYISVDCGKKFVSCVTM